MSDNLVQETQGVRPTGEGISFTGANPTDVYGVIPTLLWQKSRLT
jgi:hypothetical protein